MGQIQDLSDLVNKLTGGASGNPEVVLYHKNGRQLGAAATAPVAGRGYTFWYQDGIPASGVLPNSTGIACDTSTGLDRYMIQASMSNITFGSYIVYDRLYHKGGFVGNVTSIQTVEDDPPSAPITRNTSGVGNFMFYEINTLIGTTATNLIVNYINDLGTSSVSIARIGATGGREVNSFSLIPLAPGDKGVRSIISIQLAATTGTAGAISVGIGKPLAFLGSSVAGAPGHRDFVVGMPGIPKVDDGACVAVAYIAGTTTVPIVQGLFSFVNS
jgi:hypothetical protein